MTEEDVGTTDNPQKRLVYQYKLEPGSTKVEHYGLALAAKTNLPKDTVNLAKELAEYIGKETRVNSFLYLVLFESNTYISVFVVGNN